MRLVAFSILGWLLVSPVSGVDIDRAMSLARARDGERQQFHKPYVIDLPGPTVTQIEVTTEFRRLVIIAEDHVLRGDWMFTRGRRAAEDAIRPLRGLVTIRALVRFNPLNTFIESPPYILALGNNLLETQLTPQFSTPFRDRDRKTLSSLIGVNLDATVSADRLGQKAVTVGVFLDGKDQGHAGFDFAKLD